MKVSTYLGIIALGLLFATFAHADGRYVQQMPLDQMPLAQPCAQAQPCSLPPPVVQQQNPCACSGANAMAIPNVCSIVPVGPGYFAITSNVYGQLTVLPAPSVQGAIGHYQRVIDRATGRPICEVFQ